MSDIDMRQLMQVITIGITDGIRAGLNNLPASARRPVLYRTYDKVPKESLKFNQADGSYDWSKEEYIGTFMTFVHYNNDDLESDVIVERPDGTLAHAPISKVRFTDIS